MIGVFLLEAKAHDTRHVLGMFHEVLVVIQREALDNALLLAFYLPCLPCVVLFHSLYIGLAYVYGIG